LKTAACSAPAPPGTASNATPIAQHPIVAVAVDGDHRHDDLRALALPDHPQYRGLVNRLPSLARTRLNLEVFFVDPKGAVTTG
jgi:hypothetical protein